MVDVGGVWWMKYRRHAWRHDYDDAIVNAIATVVLSDKELAVQVNPAEGGLP